MGLNMRKSVIFTIRGCFRSIYNHPFLVFLLCVLTFICRSSPFMFSLLLYVSPVFICTAVLLGTLLFFGQQNAHRIETKEKTTHETVPIKTELSKDSIVVENNKSRSYGEKQKDNVERQTDDIFREDNKKRIRETLSDNSGEFDEKHKDERNDERFIREKKGMENDHVDDILESEYEKSEAESYDSEMVNMDSLEPQSHSAWKRVKHGDDDYDEEEEALDSEFDGAESSSPEASMPDMVPMLDELHPLLDEEEATQLVPTSSRAVSEAPSEQSPPSSIGSIDETENPEDSEVPDDDEDAHNDKEDQAAIVWTEEDKRNLMDVGSSEMERNKRLESLLLRRRSWKNRITMVPEINLIDLESSDHFPYHMMHISTTRHNPFELPHDSDIISGLPPVPSSAPPVLLPRRNPFDVPFQPYFVPEVEASYPALQRASSESSVAETESVSSVENVVEDQKVEEEEDDDDDVTHGSQSSEGEECLELGSTDEGLEHRESRQSSVSSEREINNGEGSSMVADTISRQNSDTNKEPVYDLSPTADETSPLEIDKEPILERVRTTGADDNNSDEDYVEANDKLISTPSAGGSTSLFHDRLLHEQNIDTSSELDTTSSMNVVDDQVLSKQLSSTDSKENKQLMISVKRRLSTPF